MDTTPAILILTRPTSDRAGYRYESNPIWCNHGCQPCHRICNSTNRSQSVRCKFTDRCAGYADCKKSPANDRIFPGSATPDHFHTGNLYRNLIGGKT